MRRIKIKTILLIMSFMIMFLSSDISVLASHVQAPLTTPSVAETSQPSEQQQPIQPCDSLAYARLSVDMNTITGKNYYKNKIWEIDRFESLDEAIDVWYSDQSKTYKKKIKVLVVAKYGKDNYNRWLDRREDGQYAFLYKAFKYAEKNINRAILEKNVNGINESESMAVGEMYAQEETVNGFKIAPDSDPGTLEEALSELVRGFTNSINEKIALCDASLDNLVYGRLLKYGTNYYCFELVKGNPYGIVSGMVYGWFRTIAVPIVIILFLWQLAKLAWKTKSGETRQVSKDLMGRIILMILLLFLMPLVIDALIALKDIMLNYVSTQMGEDMSALFGLDAGEKTITGYYKANAEQTETLLDALLYLGSIGITVFYVVTYISTAIAEMVNFMFFPLMITLTFTDKKLLETWFKTMLGNIFSPLLDAVLLLMPLMLNNMLSDTNGVKSYLITFIAAYAVIPSRAIIRCMLGVGGSVGSEMLGFGAMLATMRMLRGFKDRTKRGIENVVSAGREIKHNNDLANMYGDLAKANGEGNQLHGKFAKLGKNGGKLKSIEDGDGERNGTGANEANGVNGYSPEDGEGLREQSGFEKGAELNSINDEMDEPSFGEMGALASVGNEAPTGDASEGIRNPLEQQAIDKNNILKSYATTENFQNKEFANAFNFAERARLHKQKANREMVHAVTSIAGSVVGAGVGGVIGGTLASGATMFAGSRVNIPATLGGVSAGSSVGQTVMRGIPGETASIASGVAGTAANIAMSGGIRRNFSRNNNVKLRDYANGNYEGYYSKQALFDPSKTQAEPSSLQNYGNYNAERELEKVRRQQQYEERMNNYNSSTYSFGNNFNPAYADMSDIYHYVGYERSEVYDQAGSYMDAIDNELNPYHEDASEIFRQVQQEYEAQFINENQEQLKYMSYSDQKHQIENVKKQKADEIRKKVAAQMLTRGKGIEKSKLDEIQKKIFADIDANYR